jgi:1-acyl-sn-glycerol-3-phosphate acyltransferase
VSPHTVRRFTEKFGRYGFPPQAMAPVYGLAECAVGLAFPPPGRLPVIDRVDRTHLSATGHARPASADDQTPLELPACGHPLPGHEIRIVDERGRELGERRQGRIEFRGPSAMRGYFHDEAKTSELLHGDWLDTGDRGYIAGGDIFITGRIKDIIIRAGRHLYPHEIEEATAEIRGVRKGGVVVFGVSDAASGTERVVMLAETRETDPNARAALQARAHELMTDIAGTPPDEVVLVPPRTVPKTSSGKIRRSAARDLYVRGGIGEKKPAVWSQILRLAVSGAGAKGRRAIRRAGETLYAIWWWAILSAAFVFGIAAVMILPKRKLRWRVLRAICRTALRLMGIPVAISGIERLPQQGAVAIFNHSSYTDVLILTAVLPGEPAIVAKKELSGQLLVGQVLRRLGIPYVDRYETAASLADTQVLIDIARQGRTLVVFPEGTFTRRAGLTGFYLGAFKIAAEAELPVIPGIIRGTRSILRSDQWFPRHASVEVEIAEPIMPTGKEFSAVVKLRDAARAVILAKCGEPDIGELAKPDR